MWEGQDVLVASPSASAGSSYYKMWVGLNGFNPRNDSVLGSVRIGMDCMNLVILRYTQVPLTLRLHKQCTVQNKKTVSNSTTQMKGRIPK